MIRTLILAVAALSAIATAMPVQAGFTINGLSLNGVMFNGFDLNGSDVRESMGGATLMAIDLPTEMR